MDGRNTKVTFFRVEIQVVMSNENANSRYKEKLWQKREDLDVKPLANRLLSFFVDDDNNVIYNKFFSFRTHSGAFHSV